MYRIFLFLLLISVYSCKKSGDAVSATNLDEEKDLLSLYFDAATSGVISVSEPLHYMLKKPLEQDISESALQEVVKCDPAVKGKVTLTNRSMLTFTPEKPLQSNTLYEVTLDLPVLDKKVFPQKISYKIQTLEQQVKVEKRGFILQDNGKVDVIIDVFSADMLDVNLLEKCFETQGADVSIQEISTHKYQATLSYKNVTQSNKPIGFNANPVMANYETTLQPFDLTSKNLSVVHSHHDKDANEILLYFSKIMDKSQDLTGLLTIAGNTPSYTIDQNVLKIFLNDLNKMNMIDLFVSSGLSAKDGSVLPADYKMSFENKVLTPEINFVSSGNYFPSEGEFKIPIKARGLDVVKIMIVEIKQENVLHYLAWQSLEYADFYSIRMYGKPIFDQEVSMKKGLVDEDGWTVYGLDLTKQIKKNPGSIYHVSMDFLPKHTSLACKKNLEKYKVSYNIPAKNYFYSKNAQVKEEYYYYEDYSWEKNGDPCDISYYAYKQPVQKLLICSDYSVIAKKAGNDYYLALNTLKDLKAVSGADVTLYDLQGEKIISAATSGDGMAKMNVPDQNGAVIKISKNNQITYLSLDDADSNPLTEFDISGEMSETETEAFVYTDRNVWRPGDSIYVNVMFHKKNVFLPKGLPLICSFVNTENVQIQEQIKPIDIDKNQIYTFVLHTPPNARTGRYRCILTYGTQTLRQNIQVETIKPNTTETLLDISNVQNKVIYSSEINGQITSQYLTGFAAPNTKVTGVAKVYPISTPFPDYGTYAFTVPNISYDGNIELFNVKTDDAGKASFQADYDFKSINAPGTVQVEIESVLEGGGSNKEGKSFRISPFESYLGAEKKPGSGWAGNYTFKEDIPINLIHLDKKGALISSSGKVQYTIFRHVEQWWIDKYRLQHWGQFKDDSYWAFEKENSVTISGKGLVRIPKASLTRGAYKVEFTDTESGHRTAVFFTVYDGVETIQGKEAHLLELATEKDEYKTGESVALLLPDVDGAKALVSIERGKEIIEQKWHTLKSKNNKILIKSNENWAPNIYIHVTVLQPYAKSTNDFPIRMYGVKSIRMTGGLTPITPVTNLPDVLESEKKYTFTVSEKAGRPMEYTYALIDEGLLSIKGFKTPDPYQHFNGKYPLLVKTWDIYKYLMAFFSGQFAGIISIGGDDAYKADALQEVNRFKPVVIHKGSFKLSAKGSLKHTIEIPRYIGKLRLMIVAIQDGNTGNLEKMITVKNPLMVQTQFPRSLQVTDKLRLPVQLFRDDVSIQNATLKATTSQPVLKGLPTNQAISFGKENRVTHYANIEVGNTPGKTTIDMVVEGKGKTMKESTDIAVQYPNPYETKVKHVVIQPGKSAVFEVKPQGYQAVFKGQLIVSGTKAPDFVSFAEKLIEYPYGCLEQVTSNGFGQLYLDKLLDLDPKTNQERVKNLQMVVHKIGSYQKSGGMFYYWNNDYYHSWSDMYAGHFLLEMKNLGYLPQDNQILQNWIQGHFQKANNWSVSNTNENYTYEYEAMTQAYKLYILAKGNKPAKSAMNRFMTTNTSKNPLVWWLMAGSFAQSGFDSKAKELIQKAENLQLTSQTSYDYYSFGSTSRNLALIVEILSGIEGQKKKLDTYFEEMVRSYNDDSWHSTQDMGFACIATFAYYGENMALNKDVDYVVTGLKAVQNFKHKALSSRKIAISRNDWNKKIEIKNNGKSPVYVSQNDKFISNSLNQQAVSQEVKMNVRYYNATQRKNGLNEVRLGDDIEIYVSVTNPNATILRDMALNTVMPSGLELLNPRLYETERNPVREEFLYQDFKDDRAYTFFILEPGKTKTFYFKAKAAFTGDFYMPVTRCENMYKGNIFASSASGRLIINPAAR